MEPVKHILNDIWDKYPEALSNEYITVALPEVEKLIAELFALGPFYYYTLNVGNSTLCNFSESILSIHNLKKYPQHLKDVIDLVHPDDLPFVMEAEAWTLEMYKEIGFEHQTQLKSGYCFRMKTKENVYELFHHQAIHTLKDEQGRLLQTINIHTNIQSISQENNYVVTVSGIGSRHDFYQKTLRPELFALNISERLTKRELEVFVLLIKGYSDKEIAETIVISYHTVRTHHKNILKKTKSKNSKELIKKGLVQGFL
ncbi:response regulator transcription factor [Chryseobacterium gwangjuense]|uniref:response regulator transcription factor n=1 Tax=Chryseobacterium gwangjuense TaxID=1069980 RepID=UPI001E620F1E|nr:helix-turn-helix transcriptional regulator [Chryseobacterium gwangjuense]MCE3074353.1 helix-turn-helix transcriptional regulator [Chryseobacterium gwangjuense]